MTEQPPVLLQMLPFFVLFAALYFIVLRPQQKRQKEHDAMLKSLEKNADVVTSGGIHGTIVQVKDTTVSLRVCDNTRIEVEKSAIAQVKTAAKSA